MPLVLSRARTELVIVGIRMKRDWSTLIKYNVECNLLSSSLPRNPKRIILFLCVLYCYCDTSHLSL